MKKTLLSLIALALISCGGSGESLSRQSLPSSSEESSLPSAGETSLESNVSFVWPKVTELKESDYKTAFFPNYFKRLQAYASYKAVTEGKTASTVDQSIAVTVLKSGEYGYMKNQSDSFFVHTSHEAYYHGQQTYCRDKDAAFALMGLETYLNTYGTYPFENSVEGYDVLGEGLVSIEKAEVAQGHGFKITLDPKKATTNVRIQMKRFGGLDEYPSFSSIAITMSVQDDYTPIKVSVDAQYKAKMLFEADCHQTYDVTYSNFDQNLEIPGLEDAKKVEGF